MTFYTFITNPLVDVILGAILSALFSIFLFYKNRQHKIPMFSYSTKNLLSKYISNYKGLRIKYNEVEVESLNVTKLFFWNKGRASIRREDIAELDPIRFFVGDDSMIVDYGIIGKSDESINVQINISDDNKYLKLDFDYINHNEGFVIQLFHTKDDCDFNVLGTIKCNKGKIIKTKNLMEHDPRNNNPVHALFSILSNLQNKKIKNDSDNRNQENEKNKTTSSSSKISYILMIFFLLADLFYVLSSIDLLFNLEIVIMREYKEPSIYLKIIIPFITIIFILITIAGLYSMFKSRIPRSLRKCA